MDSKSLLTVEDLRTVFHTRSGVLTAVDGINLDIPPGETLGLVGESGCGKSVAARSIMRLVDEPGRVAGGRVKFLGRDLLTVSEDEMRKVRGRDIAMIFQEPMTSLDPVYTVGDQVAEALKVHGEFGGREAWQRAVEMLDLVGIPSARRRAREYPHQMSGGMRQRVMIAMALSCGPKLLIADEPTTALDATIQAQILELMKKLQGELGMAILLITHDFGVVARMCDQVAVMYAGQIVEVAKTRDILALPQMPYTEGLLRSIPNIGGSPSGRLDAIDGLVPHPKEWKQQCRFSARCRYRFERCTEMPSLFRVGDGRLSRCWLSENGTQR